MKKINTFLMNFLLAGNILLTGAYANAYGKHNPCDKQTVEQSLKMNLKLPDNFTYQIVLEKPFYHLCETALLIKYGKHARFTTAFVSPHFVMSGDTYVDKKRINIAFAEQAQKAFVQNIMNRFAKLPQLVYKPNPYTQKYIYFIAGPNSPASNKIKNTLVHLADKYSYQIRILFYPLTEKGARETASIFCEHKTFEDYLKNRYDDKHVCNSGAKQEKELVYTLSPYKILALPVFLLSNGQVILGDNNIGQVERAMKKGL